MQPFAFFVHNCQLHHDQLHSTQILLSQATTLDSQILNKQDENITTVTIADLTEPFIMFDAASLAHTLSLGQSQTHLVHDAPSILPHTSHEHYLQ